LKLAVLLALVKIGGKKLGTGLPYAAPYSCPLS